MKYKSNNNLILIVSLIMVACSPSITVNTDYDRKVDFTTYKSFTFYQLSDKGPGLSELNRERIVNSIRSELIKKGFVEISNNPDLIINATTLVNEKKQITATNYYNYGGYYRPYYWGPAYGGPTVYNVTELKEGSLIIDVIDASSKHLVWQGTGNEEIDIPMKNAEVEIPRAVIRILSGFPPRAKK
jgi:hypothetical protein